MQSNDAERRVVFVARALTHYRVPFHQQVREALAQQGIRYELVYCDGRADETAKGDMAAMSWARKVDVRYFGRGQRLCWQRGLLNIGRADLVIIGHENSLLANYPMIVASWFTGQRLAFFGHGRNFQAPSSSSAAERFKRFWTSQVHWWFAYTPRGQEAVVESGFPARKVTVFNNAVDVSAITESKKRVDPAAVRELRTTLVRGSRHVGVYVGGLYPQKRIAFLLEAARRIRQVLPDFNLVVIGGGTDAGLVRDFAGEHEWVHPVGPKFGDEKAALMALGSVMLMPGLVGLAVLDSFAYGTPMVTTDLPFHSPEIDYLQDGVNGIMVRDASDPSAYADAVVRVLADDAYRERLRHGGRLSAQIYTIEAMGGRFVDGVLAALAR